MKKRVLIATTFVLAGAAWPVAAREFSAEEVRKALDRVVADAQTQAVVLPVDVQIRSSKNWRIEKEVAVYRETLFAPGARSLAIYATDVALPRGGEIVIKNDTGQRRLIDAGDIRHGRVWTQPFKGSRLHLEMRVPANRVSSVRMTISSLDVGIRTSPPVPKAGSGAACEDFVNYECRRDDNTNGRGARASVMMSIRFPDRINVCSATLVNNTAQNGAGLVISAAQCLDADGQAPTEYRFAWNAGAPCEGDFVVLYPAEDYQTAESFGGTLRARFGDIALFELTDAVPSAANAYWAGWDRATGSNRSGEHYGVHFSLGAPRLWIRDANAFVVTTTFVNPQPDCPTAGTVCRGWLVKSSIYTADGIVGDGSAGSGLFSLDRLIGVLSQPESVSCSSPSSDAMQDVSYMALGSAWTGGGTSGTSLRSWLDPINTGVQQLSGRDAGSPAVINGACGSANNVATPSYPAANHCSAGTRQDSDTSGSDGFFNWFCNGSNGGSNASCSASKQTGSPPPGSGSWTFLVSSTYSNYTGHSNPTAQTRTSGGLADQSISGASTVWGSAGGDSGPFIRADFGSNVQVTGISFRPIASAYEGWGAAYLNNANLEYSSDGSAWSSLGPVSSADENLVTLPVNVSARYVRLTRMNGYLGVGDFFFELAGGSSPGPTNGACGSANNVTTPTYPVANHCSAGGRQDSDTSGTDGTFNWLCNGSNGGAIASCSAPKQVNPPPSGSGSWTFLVSSTYPNYSGHINPTTQTRTSGGLADQSISGASTVWGSAGGDSGPFIRADFGSNVQVTGISFRPIANAYEGWGAAYLNNANLEYSSDGSAWSSLGPVSSADENLVTLPVNVSARYVRLTRMNGYLGVGDFFFELAGGSSPGPTNGACGSANNVTTPTYPAANHCLAGTRQDLDTSGADGFFNWNCNGSGGGANVSCSAPKQTTGASGTWTFTVSGRWNASYTGDIGQQMQGSGGLADGDPVPIGGSTVWGTCDNANSQIVADFGPNPGTIATIWLKPIPSTFDGWGSSYLNGAALEYSSTGSSWKALPSSPVSASSNQLLSIPANVSARYIRLKRNGCLGVSEFNFQ